MRERCSVLVIVIIFWMKEIFHHLIYLVAYTLETKVYWVRFRAYTNIPPSPEVVFVFSVIQNCTSRLSHYCLMWGVLLNSIGLAV